jgi:hypothetical protein
MAGLAVAASPVTRAGVPVLAAADLVLTAAVTTADYGS